MKLDQACSEICRVGRSLFERGYVHATAGNISVRLAQDQGFVITPTNACLGFLEPALLAWVSASGELMRGDPASKTLALHRRIYEGDSNAHCVIHTHSTHLVALTLRGVWRTEDIVPPLTAYYVMKVGHVPLIPVPPARRSGCRGTCRSGHRRGAARAAPDPGRDAQPPRSPAQTMATLEELEETARLWLMSNCSATPLGEAQIEELRVTFDARR